MNEVKRYRPDIEEDSWYAMGELIRGHQAVMVEDEEGLFVLYSDYQELFSKYISLLEL